MTKNILLAKDIRSQQKQQKRQLALEKENQRAQQKLHKQRNKSYNEFTNPVKVLKADLLLIMDELKTEGIITSFERDNGTSSLEGSTHASCSITLNCNKVIQCSVAFLLRSDELLPFSENSKGLSIKLMVNKLIANYYLLKERLIASITVRQSGLHHEYETLKRAIDYIKRHSTGSLHSVRHSTPYEDTIFKIDLVFMWKSHKGPIPGPFIDVKSKFPSYKIALADWYKLENRDQYGFPMYINDNESDYNFEKFMERVIERGYEMHGRD